MSCEQVRQALATGSPSEPAIAAHVESCAACAAVVAVHEPLRQADKSVSPVPSSLSKAVVDAVAADRGPLPWLRQRPTSTRVILLVLVAVGLGGSQFGALRPDWVIHPMNRMGAAVAAFASLAAVAAWVGLRPLYVPPLSRQRLALLATALIAIPVVLAALPAAHLAHPASVAGTGDDFVRLAVACFTFGSIMAVPFIVAAWCLARMGHTSWSTALMAAAGGALVGNIALQLHCPITQPIHLLAGHATIAPILMLVYGAGSSYFAKRRS